MEIQPEKRRTIKFVEIHNPGQDSDLKVQITTKHFESSLILSLGESNELVGDDFEVQLIKNTEEIGPKILIPHDTENWLPITDEISVRIIIQNSVASIKTSSKLQILGLGQIKPSPCEYIKRLQEIEEKERIITRILLDYKNKFPDSYKNILDGSPTSSLKRSTFKKKTLEVDSLASFGPDYCFDSYFDVNLENVSGAETDLLQNTAIGMITKLKSLKIDVEEYELTQEVIQEFHSPMKNLADSVVESREQFEIEENKKIELLASLENEIFSLDEEILKVDKEKILIQEEIDLLKEQKSEQILENDALEVENAEKIETRSLRTELSEILKEIQELEENYFSITESFQKNYPEQELAMAINDKILRLSELHRLTNARDSSIGENIQLQSELLITEGEIIIQQDLETQSKAYDSERSFYSKSINQTSSELSDLKDENSKLLEISSKDLENLSESLTPLYSLLESYKIELENFDLNFFKANENLSEIAKNNSQLNVILNCEKQIINEYSEFKKKYEASKDIQNSIQTELDWLSDTFLKLSENSLCAGRLLRKTEDKIEEQDLQKLTMFKLIAMIKETKPAHIAVQNDSTDMALAKYLNERHKTLDINFKRTEKEKYTFGTMKVEIKKEEELMILFEGKKAKIEEFLEAYTPIEKERNAKRTTTRVQEKTEPKQAKTGKVPTIPLKQVFKKAK